MKKLSALALMALVLLFSFTSCEEKKTEDENGVMSKLTPEQNKQNVEDEGIAFVAELDEMKDLKMMDIMEELIEILEISDPFSDESGDEMKKSALFSWMGQIVDFSNDKQSLLKAGLSIKDVGDDPEGPQEVWNEIKGRTFTWNPSTQEWVETSNSDSEFIMIFESTEGEAIITIADYSGFMPSSTIFEDYEGDLPENLSVEMKVESDVLLDISFEASYNNDGVPSTMELTIAMDDYTLTYSASNQDQEDVSVSYSLKKGNETMISMGVSAKGNFSEEAYNENTTTVYENVYRVEWNEETQRYEETDEVLYVDEWEETDAGEILNTANAYIQIMNLKLEGNVNFKVLWDEMDEIDDQEDIDPNFDVEQAMGDFIDVMNDNASIKLKYVDSKEVIATSEFYLIEEYDEWDEDYDYYPGAYIVYSDGTKVELETYFEGEEIDDDFADLIEELEDFFEGLEEDFE